MTGAPSVERGAYAAAVAAIIALALNASSLFNNSFALFLKPVSAAMGWNLAVFPRGVLSFSIVYALSAPFSGRMADRLGARRLMLIGVPVTAVGLYALSSMSSSPLQLSACAVLLGIAAGLISPATLSGFIARWFVQRRGLAMGVVLGAGPMLGVATLSPLLSSIIQAQGWRFAYQALAVIVIGVSGPVSLLLLREAPASVEEAGVTTPAAGPLDPSAPASPQAALRARDFWLLFAVTALLGIEFGGITGHIVAWQSDYGMSPEFGARLLSAIFVGAVTGPIVAGVAMDRMIKPQVLLPFVAIPMLGLIMLMLRVGGAAAALLSAGSLGLGFSAWAGQLPLMVTRYFGVASTGQIAGLCIGAGGICIGIGPVLIGTLRTGYGAYEPAVIACIGMLAVASLCVALLRPFRIHLDSERTALAERAL